MSAVRDSEDRKKLTTGDHARNVLRGGLLCVVSLSWGVERVRVRKYAQTGLGSSERLRKWSGGVQETIPAWQM